MKILENKSQEELLKLATEELRSLFESNKNTPILFLTSGGSSLDILENLKVTHSHFSLGVLDERYDTDSNINNFAILSQTQFFKENEKQFVNIFDTRVREQETLDEFSGRFDRLLKDWISNNPDGVVIATIGMGSDGHIAGIMPFPENEVIFEGLFNDPRRYVVGYDAGDKNQYSQRVTTNLPFLKRVDFAVAYITGYKKKDAFSRVLADEGKLSETPARVLHEMKQVIVFTDITLSDQSPF